VTSVSTWATARVPAALEGQRLDQAAAALFSDFSRARLQYWISAGDLRVDGAARRPKDRLAGGEWLCLDARLESAGDWVEQAVPFRVVYEDAELLVIDKPAGLVVHPGAGNRDGTLLNGLLRHCPGLRALPRVGIVHRLDKDTTGLLVVSKTLRAHADLVAQLRARSVSREYAALVRGLVISGGTVTARITPDPFGQVVVLEVEDSGPGIPAAERELVFRPFYRALGTEVDGSGLGLAIVREIAEKHGATVSLEDTNNKPAPHGPGARFTVRFPVAARR
jgi:23S rRNA-/tRNA-specific pseudouridylate synthase